MKARHDGEDEVARLFRDVVLVLGGVFAVRQIDDDTIRRVATGLEGAYRRARSRCPDGIRPAPPPPHPAIIALLRLTEADRSGR